MLDDADFTWHFNVCPRRTKIISVGEFGVAQRKTSQPIERHRHNTRYSASEPRLLLLKIELIPSLEIFPLGAATEMGVPV